MYIVNLIVLYLFQAYNEIAMALVQSTLVPLKWLIFFLYIISPLWKTKLKALHSD